MTEQSTIPITRLYVPASYRSIVESVRRKCRYHGIKFKIVDQSIIQDPDDPDDYCGGYFDGDARELAIAIKMPFDHWFPTFIHESSHLDQWVRWSEDDWSKFCYATGDFYRLASKAERSRYETRKLSKATDIVMAAEFDCEKRTIDKYIKFDLPVSIEDQIRKMNCYLYGMQYLSDKDSWQPGIMIQTECWMTAPAIVPDSHRAYQIIPKDLKRSFDVWYRLHKQYQKSKR